MTQLLQGTPRAHPPHYGFTCVNCGVDLDFTLPELEAALVYVKDAYRARGLDFMVGIPDAADHLRTQNGWSLTDCEYPFDGNAHYYCPACHTPAINEEI